MNAVSLSALFSLRHELFCRHRACLVDIYSLSYLFVFDVVAVVRLLSASTSCFLTSATARQYHVSSIDVVYHNKSCP